MTHFIFPKPSDWNTLEDVVADVFSRKYQNYNFQRYGRNGQSQSGIDIAGPTESGVIGIQCKHHPTGSISTKEIDGELASSEKFSPSLTEYVIATSAERDAKVHNHVLKLSEKRKKAGKYPVTVKFWDDIYNWLVEYPDLLYKHFTKYFPVSELENISMPGVSDKKLSTVKWPVTLEELESNTKKNVGGINRVGSYRLTIGLNSFQEISSNGLADLELQLAYLFSDKGNPVDNFEKASEILKETKAIITRGDYSKELMVHLQARLSLAFLFGWIFRKVSHHELTLVFGNQIWSTFGLPVVPARLTESLPEMRDFQSKEVVLILNISRDIDRSVSEFVGTWENQPQSLLTISVEGHAISSAAHALAVATELSRKIKSIINVWGVQKIHLFGALPAVLATLIGFHLNAIGPINLYFLDESRTTYELGGILHNSL